MNNTSKEFNNAMKGILNGEEWQRKEFSFGVKIIDNRMIRECYLDGVLTRKDFTLTLLDMVANDWKKI